MRQAWRLPELRGSVFQMYRIVWVVLFLAFAISSSLGIWRGEHQEREATRAYNRIGLGVVQGAHETAVVLLWPQARRAGIRKSDVLLQVGDHRTSGKDSSDSGDLLRALSAPDGHGVLVRTAAASGGGPSRTVELTARDANLSDLYQGSGLSFDLKEDIVLWVALIGGLIPLIAALMLFIRRPQDPVAALISLGMIISLNFSLNNSDANGLVVALPVLEKLPAGPVPLYTHVSAALSLPLLLTGLLFFPSGVLERRWMLWVILPLACITFAGFGYPPDLLLGIANLLTAGLVAVAVLQRFRGAPPGRERQQIKWVAVGVAGAIIAGTIVTVGYIAQLSSNLPPTLAPWVSLVVRSTAYLVFPCLALGFLVSLLRYRLYDADAFIGRSAAYAILTLLLGAVFAGSEKVIEKVGEQLYGREAGVAAAGVAAAVAVIVIAPLQDRIRGWVQKRFERALANLETLLPSLVAELREVVDLDTLLGVVLERVQSGVQATRAAVLVGDEVARVREISAAVVEDWRTGWMPNMRGDIDRDSSDAVFPIRIALRVEGMGLIGWMLLGPRPDGTLYRKDERAALAKVAGDIARAVQLVRQRELRNADIERRLSRLESTMLRATPGIADIEFEPPRVTIDTRPAEFS